MPVHKELNKEFEEMLSKRLLAAKEELINSAIVSSSINDLLTYGTCALRINRDLTIEKVDIFI